MDQLLEPITRLQDLRSGDIGLGPIHGAVGVGVGIGQWVLGEGWTLSEDDEIQIRHASIVSKPAEVWGDGYIAKPPEHVEAMPPGARRIRAARWNREWAYVRIPEDYPGQAEDAAYVARLMAAADVDYSPASYLALSVWRAGLSGHGLEAWINRRQSDTAFWLPSGRKMTTDLPMEAICSVLVDQAWTLTGKKIMLGVPHQCVTPAALARRLRFATPGAVWAFPGR
jgi:hypothetical protein